MTRRLIRIAAMILFLAGAASLRANQRVNVTCAVTGNVITQGLPSTNKAAVVYPSCLITVYLTGTTTLATIYSDNNNTPLNNPFTANTAGQGFFYAGLGRYDVLLTGGGLPQPVTISDVLLQDVTNINGTFAISGSGPPTTTCTAANQGQTYTDTSTGHLYACSGTAWVVNQGPVGQPGPVGPVGPVGPAGPMGGSLSYPGVVTDTNNGLNVTGGVQTGGPVNANSVVSPNIGGTRFCSQYQTPPSTGNNGCANAAAPNQTFVADPSYPNTEYYFYGDLNTGGTHRLSMAPSPTHAIDYRNGVAMDVFHNPLASLWDSNQDAYISVLNQDALPSGVTFGRPNQMLLYSYYTQPGQYLGCCLAGPTGGSSGNSLSLQATINSAAIWQTLYPNLWKGSPGDSAIIYGYSTGYGGNIAHNDEGQRGSAFNVSESTTTFKGTIKTGGGGAGVTSVKVTCTADCGPVQGGPANGRFLVDTQTAIDSGFVTAAPTGGGNAPYSLAVAPTSGGIPVISAAFGTLNANCNSATVPTPPGTGTNTVNCAVTVTGGTNAGGFVASTTSLVCFTGQFHEQAIITGVTGTAPNQTLTMNLRHSHLAGSWILQGDPCGQFIDMSFNDQASGVLHYPLEIVGAPDTTHYYMANFVSGVNQNLNLGNVFLQTWPVTGLTNTGGQVYFNCPSCAVGLYTGQTAQFTSPSVAAYGASSCTNLRWAQYSSSSGWTCTQTGSIGAASGATANIILGTVAGGQGAYTVWRGAEVLNVLDTSVSPPTINNAGTSALTLEPNTSAWANADAVEEPHHYTARITGTKSAVSELNPYTGGGASTGLDVPIAGQGFHNAAAITVENNEPNSSYSYVGNLTAVPPAIISTQGAFEYGLYMKNAPSPPLNTGAAMLYAGCPLSGCNDPVQSYYVFQNTGVAFGTGLLFRPYISSYVTAGNWIWTSDFQKQTFRDNIVGGVLAPPTLSVPVPVTNGGNLADGAPFCYKIVPYNTASTSASGGLPSNEQCITTGASGSNINSVPLLWTHSQGATGYIVCRGATTGTEQKGPNITIAAGAFNQEGTYVDNGSNAFAGGACNSTDTSLPIIDNFASLNLNSSGTAFKVTYKAPAGITANITGTLPLTIAAGTANMPTTAITSGGCAANVTAISASVLATDAISYSFSGVPDATWGELIIHPFVTAGGIGFTVCNPAGGASVTPAAATVNWRVAR